MSKLRITAQALVDAWDNHGKLIHSSIHCAMGDLERVLREPDETPSPPRELRQLAERLYVQARGDSNVFGASDATLAECCYGSARKFLAYTPEEKA